MQKGDKARVINGVFKGAEGVISEVKKCICWGSEEFINKFGTMRVTLEFDNFETITVNSANIEIIDSFPKEFNMEDDYNYIAIRSNIDNWERAIEKYRKNKNENIIFLTTNNYNTDDNETVSNFTSLSVPQAKYLIKSLNEIIEYIEDKSK